MHKVKLIQDKPVKSNFKIILLITLILTVLSFLMIIEQTGREPFLDFIPADAWILLVCCTAIILLLIELFIWIVLLLIKNAKNIRYYVLAIWILFVLFWVIQIPAMYIYEFQKYHKIHMKRC